jgi:hypothetical protein
MSGISLTSQANQKVRQAAPWLEAAGRIGYAAKGIVYIVIGVLAVKLAAYSEGKNTDSQGALGTIAHQTFGTALLAIVGVGLASYALWRFVSALFDADHKGRDAKGIAARVGFAVSGGAYTGLAYLAFKMVIGTESGPKSQQKTQDWTARFLAMPWGQWLVGAVGLVIIGIGLSQIAIGVKAKFKKRLALDKMSTAGQKWAVAIGRWGYAARGVVFSIVGGFFIQAAVNFNPKEAKGLGSALDLLAQQPYGRWLLGIVAAGLVAYGVFMLVEARYRRIAVSKNIFFSG